MDGVESAEVSLETGSVDIKLKADNRISLPQLRRTIRSNGSETGDTQISAPCCRYWTRSSGPSGLCRRADCPRMAGFRCGELSTGQARRGARSIPTLSSPSLTSVQRGLSEPDIALLAEIVRRNQSNIERDGFPTDVPLPLLLPCCAAVTVTTRTSASRSLSKCFQCFPDQQSSARPHTETSVCAGIHKRAAQHLCDRNRRR